MLTDEDKLTLTCALLGLDPDSADDKADVSLVETAYLPLAKHYVLVTRHPFSEDADEEGWETRYDHLHCEIAAAMFSRRGSEGETRHDENGVDRKWDTDSTVPKSLAQRIVPLAKVRSLA